MDFNKAAADALRELGEKSIRDIQVETAVKWCGRAVAARTMGLDDRDVTEFAHEAIEHAALSGDDELLRTVRRALAQFNIST
ncbi:MAG: hypothetical protein EBZ49_01530 [Proteobacteria bacterium]|jgi:hypothetical protein|nr:hypothetical protein [Pseudomonadota bacterium]